MDPLSLIACMSPRWDSYGQGDGDAEDATMDANVWQKLPEELLERVLASLPLPSLLRLRTMSKQWSRTIASEAFMNYRFQHFRSRGPCYIVNPFMVRRRIGFVFYNPVFRMWHQHMMPKSWWRIYDGLNELYPPGLVASDAGLLLLGVEACPIFKTWLSYVVCNPITRAYVKVPTYSPLGHHYFVRILADPDAMAFKIVMACNTSDASDQTTKIYDSTIGLWSTMSNVWRIPPALFLDSCQNGVICSGMMYLIAGSGNADTIVGLNLESGVWSKVQRIPETFLRPHLIERHGRLAVVGGLDNIFTSARLPNPQAIGIWNVDESMAWGEAERLPKLLCKELLKWINFADFRCTGQHDMLYFSSSAVGQDVMAYDLVKKSWHWLPESQRPSQYDPWWMPLPFDPSLIQIHDFDWQM